MHSTSCGCFSWTSKADVVVPFDLPSKPQDIRVKHVGTDTKQDRKSSNPNPALIKARVDVSVWEGAFLLDWFKGKPRVLQTVFWGTPN